MTTPTESQALEIAVTALKAIANCKGYDPFHVNEDLLAEIVTSLVVEAEQTLAIINPRSKSELRRIAVQTEEK